ncbi:MAG: hypothetical protein JWM63_5754 [Gammaproteobacteria bacterium]|nr:hypothetical protein [Gammaproteobacteria bacterium]
MVTQTTDGGSMETGATNSTNSAGTDSTAICWK